MKRSRSAGGVVLNPTGRVLMVSQRGKSWSLPKGHLEKGEGPLTAARREIYEESGVSELKLVRFLGAYERAASSGGEVKELTFYLFRAPARRHLKPLDPDHPEARWVNKNKVPGLLIHPEDRAFFRKVLKGL